MYIWGVWRMEKMPKMNAQTRQWRISCSSCNCHSWRSRNRRRHIDSHPSAATRPARRSLPQAHPPYPRSPAWIPRRSWTLCTGEPSSISSPWTSFCTRPSPTFRSSPALRQHRIRLDLGNNFQKKKKREIHKTYHLESHSHRRWRFFYWRREVIWIQSMMHGVCYIEMWVPEMPLESTTITILFSQSYRSMDKYNNQSIVITICSEWLVWSDHFARSFTNLIK